MALFAVCRRRFHLFALTERLPQLYAVMSAHMRRRVELVTAEVYLEQAGLPLSFTQALRSDVLRPVAPAAAASRPSPERSSRTAPPLPALGRASLSTERAALVLERFRTGERDLSATLTSLLEHGVTAATVQVIQHEVCRHVLLLTLSPSSTTATVAYRYCAPPHLRSAMLRLRLSELCCALREVAVASAELGRERVNAAESLIAIVLDLCSALPTADSAAVAAFVSAWRLQDVWGAAGGGFSGTLRMTDVDPSDPSDVVRAMKSVLSLFLVMAVNRHCLRLSRLVQGLCEAVDRGVASSHAIDVVTAVFSPSFPLEMWDIDRARLDAAIYAEGTELFPLIPCLLLSSERSPSSAALDGVLCLVRCAAFQQSCARHAPSLLALLSTVKRPEHRLALFQCIDDGIHAQREDERRGLDGMEGVALPMLQELERIRRVWANRSPAAALPPSSPAAAVDLSSPTAPPSPSALLSALSVWTLPSLHVPLHFALSRCSEAERSAFLSSLLAQSSTPLALPLLRVLSSTDAAVCGLLVDGLVVQLTSYVDAVVKALSTPHPEDPALALLARLRLSASPTVPAPSLGQDSLLWSLCACAHFSSSQRSEAARRVISSLVALAQAASVSSAALLSAAMSASFLSAVERCRQWLLPLLPHVDPSGKSSELEELLKAALALLLFPLPELSASPTCAPFLPFLSFFSQAVDRLRWQAALLGPAQRPPPRSDQLLFELHTLHLALTRRRPVAAVWSEAVARCIPSAQGGALTDELLFVLPTAMAIVHPAAQQQQAPAGGAGGGGGGGGTGGGGAVGIGGGSVAGAASAARQPVDPWSVLEACGAGPVVDSLWESSQAARRPAPS